MGESANSFASPFESGYWGRWTNLERFNWLRSFHRGIEEKREAIAQGFTLNEAKMKRLADAVELLKAKVTEEMNITEQAVKYGEAIIGRRGLACFRALLALVGENTDGEESGSFLL